MSLATEADMRAAFKKFDVDGNGFLSWDELKALLQRSGGGKALTDSEVSEFMYRFDAYEAGGNEDGKLSIVELVNGLTASQLYTACLPKNLKPEEFKKLLTQASWKQLSWIGGPKQGPCKDVFRLLIEQKKHTLLKTALDVAMNMSGVGKDQLAIQLNKVMTREATTPAATSSSRTSSRSSTTQASSSSTRRRRSSTSTTTAPARRRRRRRWWRRSCARWST